MFRIGEFSKIAQVATSQLRFYDRKGLFQPEYIDKFTGYRYYRATQLPELHRILAMKELGLSLEQIQELIDDNVSAEALRGMLALKKAQIQQELKAQVVRLNHIEARLRLVEQETDVSEADVVLKSLPAQRFYGFRDIMPDIRQVRNIAIELGNFLPSKIAKKKLSHLTVLQHTDGFSMTDADIEVGYLLNGEVNKTLTSSDGHTLKMRTLSAVEEAACIIRVGGPDKGYQCYDSLARWADANGYRISGVVREVFIVPPRPGGGKEMVMELQVPVTLRENPTILLS